MKIHCIIQARLGSTRLPGKVLMDIGGKTMLRMVYDRCVLATGTDKTIIAFHGDDINDAKLRVDRPGAIWVERPEEPAARFVKVLAEYPCDGFVRVCADSPFIDHGMITVAAEQIRFAELDYWLTGNSRIHGNQAEGFNTQAFLNAEPSMQGDEREHLGLWFQRRDRLTVDTPGDLERARLIVSRMTKPHTEYTAAECLELLRSEGK